MTRTLIIPAAGAGSRLGSPLPKLLVPVSGRPMIEHLLDLYDDFVTEVALVINPAAADAVRRELAGLGIPVLLVKQEVPTGMLDAILLALNSFERTYPDRVWITWCDQIAIHPRTLDRLAQADLAADAADLIMPTTLRPDPYIHLDRDASGSIVRILQRREGDTMPAAGESDSGLFDLSRRAFTEWLPEFAQSERPSTGTRERNFLPFIAWVAARTRVETFPCTEPEEAIGINTPAELAFVESHLRSRSRA